MERPGEKVDFRSVVYFYGRNFGVLSGIYYSLRACVNSFRDVLV